VRRSNGRAPWSYDALKSRGSSSSRGVVGMRKVLIAMYMTLDGVAEIPEYAEGAGSSAPSEGPPMWRARMDATDTLLLGRRTYELWAGYWPRQQDDPSASPFQKEFSRFADRAEKVVFSKTLKSADWPRSRIVSGDPGEEVRRLKSLPGKDIVLGGGPRLAQSFLARELADELFIEISPSIVGSGKPLFHVEVNPDHAEDFVPLGAPGRHDFKLIEAQSQNDGTVLLHYARSGSGDPRGTPP
jgi:dihydrofolate reductase